MCNTFGMYVQVQPGEHMELLRTRAERANAVFLLNSSAAYAPPPLTSKPFFCCVSDRSCRYEEPRELDNRISLYMVLVKQYVLGVGGWF